MSLARDQELDAPLLGMNQETLASKKKVFEAGKGTLTRNEGQMGDGSIKGMPSNAMLNES